MCGELSDNCVESRTVQQGDGCITVVLPSKPAADLKIGPGDAVLFTGENGDSALRVQRADVILAE